MPPRNTTVILELGELNYIRDLILESQYATDDDHDMDIILLAKLGVTAEWNSNAGKLHGLNLLALAEQEQGW